MTVRSLSLITTKELIGKKSSRFSLSLDQCLRLDSRPYIQIAWSLL